MLPAKGLKAIPDDILVVCKWGGVVIVIPTVAPVLKKIYYGPNLTLTQRSQWIN